MWRGVREATDQVVAAGRATSPAVMGFSLVLHLVAGAPERQRVERMENDVAARRVVELGEEFCWS